MQVVSSSGCRGVFAAYLFFITIAIGYHISFWQPSISSRLGSTTPIPTPVLNKRQSNIQSVVESPSQIQQVQRRGILRVDTKKRIVEAVSTSNKIKITAEINCLAMNIYFEARGESTEGQLAVGHVVMNRVSDTKFPDTVCKVVYQGGQAHRNRCQFSWWCDGKSDVPQDKDAWLTALELSRDIINGQTDDPTGGALWYHATYVKPYWRRAFAVGSRIGRHVFYRYV